MNVLGWLAGAAFLVGALPAPCLAQAPSQDALPRPEVKIGERWIYRHVDLESKRVIRVVETQVTGVSERAILTSVRNPADGAEVESIQTAEWNVVSGATGVIYEPHSGQFRFPMKAGDTWGSRYWLKQPKMGAFQVNHDRTVKVVGWEDVEVPAGKFRALKVISEGTFERVDTAVSGKATEVMWYVPEVKRFVKWTYEDATFRGRFNWWALELTEYKLQ